MSGPAVDRFWDKALKPEGDECWEWAGAKEGRTGYGLFWQNGKHVRAHRVAFALANGYLPTQGVIRHLCGNSGCVNPSHLAHGTAADNRNDAVRHGTAYTVVPQGLEKHPMAVLTNDLVIDMRRMFGAGSRVVDIARETGHKYSTVWAAVHRQNFAALQKEKNDADENTVRRRDQGTT